MRRINHEKLLIGAVSKNLVSLTREVLKSDVDAEVVDWRSYTPLTIACQKGYLKIVKLFVEYSNFNNSKKDINLERPDNNALIEACTYGQLEVVKYLLSLKNKPNIEAFDRSGKTALMRASENWELQVANLLIDEGANVNAINDRGETALILVSFYHCGLEMIKLLIKRGANVRIRNKEGKTALDIAMGKVNPNVSIINFLESADEKNCFF
jgi:ankyrin repeat protein